MSQIGTDVLRVLRAVEIEGSNVRITEQLDRKLYQAVNEVLERIGGKWNRKAKAHVFSVEPGARLEAVINSGQLDPKIKTGYFPTPEKVVRQMIQLLELHPNDTILEPSAGQGGIADYLKGHDLLLIEKLPGNRQILKQKGYFVSDCDDFLQYRIIGFSKIIMNPPFENQADVEHVTHALSLLKTGGILVSVMSAGVLFRNNKKTQKFREDILNYAEVIPLPEGSFKESGTMVNTILVKIRKAAI